MPLSPQERSSLNAALGNAVDSLQAELEAYRMLLFVFLMRADGDVSLLFLQTRQIVESRRLTGISPEEAARQRDVTLAALDSLAADLRAARTFSGPFAAANGNN